MKRVFFRFFILVCTPLFTVACTYSEKLSGNEFLIEGEISDLEDGTVIHLTRWGNFSGQSIATDTLRNRRFMFKEEAESSTDKLSVSPRGDGFSSMLLYVWAAPGAKIKIRGEGKLHPLWKVKSSVPYQKEQNLYQDINRDIIAECARISVERNAAISKIMTAASRDESIPYRNIVDSLDVINNSLSLKETFANVDIMEKTKNVSPVWLEQMYMVGYYSRPSNDGKEYYGELRKKAEALYDRMSEDDKNTFRGNMITADLFPPPVVRVGDYMVDTDFVDINGNTKRLSDYLDKYLLLDFWHIGCGPCIAAFPEMKEIADSYSENLTIIGIYLDSDAGWKKALTTYDTPGINLRDPKAFGGLAANYGLKGIPYYVMISPDGKVVDIWGGYGKGSLMRKVRENVK